MKSSPIKLLLICLFLSACSQTPIPYHLTKSVERDYRLSWREIPLGVTQEKISEKEYRITARLNEVSTRKQAKSMALYHAAILAEEQGYDAFFIKGNSGSDGCSRSTTKYGHAVATQSGRVQISQNPIHTTSVTSVEPRGGVFIILMDSEKTNKRKRNNNKFHLAKDIKAEHKPIIDHIPSEVELEKVSEENSATCEQKRIAQKGG
ncbi:hypothetical protein WNY51_18225 [Pseudocolwellia sp. AS88]|uniref:CC0125/CC1285 family lipoprotein n=1 Tax=Pseudocolwellia sp. AS88 TaxID=3063958 RepID=UPI0026EA54FD|nr:hypothetical protein [Pseudocolwellia sp. AS88]MDO7085508.1 hypothetical protein [Pseudocolwellia sp. AS88]